MLAKWLLIGRWKPQEIRLWSLGYLRFWAVKTLIRTNPWVMFAGSPLYLLYLRALGAKIGKGVTIFSTTVPVCTDMLRIGSHTVIRSGASFSGYHADGGVIRTGAITIGADAVVAEGAVLDRGDVDRRRRPARARLVAARRAVDPGGGALARLPGAAHRHRLRRRRPRPAAAASGGSSTAACSCSTCWCSRRSLATAVLWVLQRISYVSDIVGPGPLAAMRGGFYLEQLALAAVVLFGGFARGPALRRHRAAAAAPVPRPGNGLPALRHPLLGAAVRRAHDEHRRSSSTSSATAPTSWATCAGSGTACRASGQTGSNFGASLTHVTPYLCVIGEDTMVSDGVALTTASCSSTSFKTGETAIGARSFLGNAITYPAGRQDRGELSWSAPRP